MSHPEELKRLNAEITRHMSHLNKCLIKVLAMYVLGMVIMQHCGQSRLSDIKSAKAYGSLLLLSNQPVEKHITPPYIF